jgi:hypothetical protein
MDYAQTVTDDPGWRIVLLPVKICALFLSIVLFTVGLVAKILFFGMPFMAGAISARWAPTNDQPSSAHTNVSPPPLTQSRPRR